MHPGGQDFIVCRQYHLISEQILWQELMSVSFIKQMKMFLTRLGFGSKIVITGDITQIDLPGDKVSGLKEAIRVLDGVEDIQICRLTPADVVRHVLVQRIVAAYDKYEKNRLPDERARTFTKKPDWKREKK